LLVVDLATEGEDAPTSLRIKKEEWPGDTRTFADLGMEGIYRSGQILRTSDVTIGDLAAIEVDALHDRSVPPVRMLHRCAAKDGVGWVVQASADPDRFAHVAPVLRAILGTLRFRAR
jgi:hypothetical protein